MTAAVDAERERTIALLERLVNRNSGTLNLEGVARGRRDDARRARAAGLHGPLGRHARDRARRPSRRHPCRARPQRPADRPSRHGVRAGQPVPALHPQRQPRHRPRHRRRQGRHRRDRRRAARDAGGRDAPRRQYHHRPDRRRGADRLADRGRPPRPDRGRARRRFRAGVRESGARGRPRHGLRRPPELDQLDADRARPHRPQLRRLRRRIWAAARSTSWPGSSTPSAASCPSRTSPTMSASIAGGTPATIDADGFRATASGKTNIVAETAIARGDIRTLTAGAGCARARAHAGDRRRSICRNTSAELVFGEDGYPPMAPTAGNRALLARAQRGEPRPRPAGDGRVRPRPPGRRGFGLRRRRTWTRWPGLGAAGGNTHAEGEWVDLDSLSRQAKRAAILITRLTRERRN